MKVKASVALAASMVAGSAMLLVTPAQAVGGNCNAYREQKVIKNAPDEWRTRARCSSLQADSRAKGYIGPTKNTGWFTAINTNKYTGWYSFFGRTPGYKVIVEHV